MGISRGYVFKPDSRLPCTLANLILKTSILIGNDGRARLTGSGLLTTTSDRLTSTSSCMVGSAVQWASPELLYPEMFGLKDCCPTMESDCYALGMVLYEVVSGETPFGRLNDDVVMQRVKAGSRPERPRGEKGTLFTDALWYVVGFCWTHQPCDRISARVVLLGLEGTPPPLWPSPNAGGDVEADADGRLTITASESGMFSLSSSRLMVNRPCGAIGPTIVHGDDELPVPPRGYSERGWIGDWLVDIAWRAFTVATGQLHIFWRARWEPATHPTPVVLVSRKG